MTCLVMQCLSHGQESLRYKLGEGADVHSGGPLASDIESFLWPTRLLRLYLYTTSQLVRDEDQVQLLL